MNALPSDLLFMGFHDVWSRDEVREEREFLAKQRKMAPDSEFEELIAPSQRIRLRPGEYRVSVWRFPN